METLAFILHNLPQIGERTVEHLSIVSVAVGIAILNHPSSFRYPTTWHVRDYGLFAANPFGWHDFGQKTSGEHILPNGESIRFRYRIILHDGDTASSDLPAAFKAYEAPPKATIE